MPPHLIVEAKLLRPDAKLPAYMSDGAAGMDLYALVDDVVGVTIAPGIRSLISTGVALSIPFGWEGQIRPRSGAAVRDGLGVLNSPGTIDADYRGEVKVLLVNLGQQPVTVSRGDRVAQIVFCPVGRATLQCVSEFSTSSARGEGGFGSSGKD